MAGSETRNGFMNICPALIVDEAGSAEKGKFHVKGILTFSADWLVDKLSILVCLVIHN